MLHQDKVVPDWTSPCGTVQLYCADCRDILPHLGKVDAVVTDPPYGIGDRMQGGTWGAADKYADFREWDVAPSVDAMRELLGMAGVAVVWGGNYFPLPPSRCWLVWDKTNAVRTMADCELAWTNIDKPTKRYARPVGVHRTGHPTEKPLDLMEWCIEQLPGDCQSILDPYMGSGTTGVAAVKAGKSFIGIERERHYFEIAQRRIMDALGMETVGKDGMTQRRMFAP